MPWEEPPELHSGQVEQVRNREQALNALARIPGAGATSGGFVVDPERVEAAISALKRIVLDLEAAHLDWRRTEIPPPTLDGVGLNLVSNTSRMAENAVAWLVSWTSQIAATIDALQAQLNNYRCTEHHLTAGLL